MKPKRFACYFGFVSISKIKKLYVGCPTSNLFFSGSQEVIFISHIVGPHNFFVQRACHQDLVKELHREYRNSVSLPKPSPGHITEGNFEGFFKVILISSEFGLVMATVTNDTGIFVIYVPFHYWRLDCY